MTQQKGLTPQLEHDLSKGLTKELAKQLILDMHQNAGVLAEVQNQEILNSVLNSPPPAKWLKKHPMVSNALYLPIDKVEWMLRVFFKRTRIEVINVMQLFNAVQVTVRVWYFNPAISDMDYHDGVGASQIQTKKGSSPADLSNINHGAVDRAVPIAKTNAIKDACDHLGKVFGSDLNRKDVIEHTVDNELLLTGKTINDALTVQRKLRSELAKYKGEDKEEIETMLNEKKEANELTIELMQNTLDQITNGK